MNIIKSYGTNQPSDKIRMENPSQRHELLLKELQEARKGIMAERIELHEVKDNIEVFFR